MDSRLHKKAFLLSYITVGYNILEGIVSIFAGLLAKKIHCLQTSLLQMNSIDLCWIISW
jgi:hypothetical protein